MEAELHTGEASKVDTLVRSQHRYFVRAGGVWHTLDMSTPTFIRPLTHEEREQLQARLHSSSDSFVLRRCQVLLASSEGQTPQQIATSVGRTPQTVRNVIRAFHDQGLSCLNRQSNRPKQLHTIFDASEREALRELLHQSPRAFDKPTSLWTLQLAAEVSFEQGLSPHQVSIETIRQALKKLGKSWQRAKHWISSPDPDYLRKKGPETG
jgi:transposase